MSRRAALPAALLLALLGLAAFASTASASFHLMKIREVASGSAADTSYVELQMYAAGQNFVGGHQIKLYNATALTHTFTFPSTPVPAVPNATSQSTILVGDTNSPGTPDFTEAGFAVNASGGAACFDSIPVDCVSWGTGTSAALPGTVGSPAPALTTTMALRRSIQPSCSTLLESIDDTDDSATDFSLQTPNPRNNSVTPIETDCFGNAVPVTLPATTIPELPPALIQPFPPAGRKKCKKRKHAAAAAKKKCKKRR